MARPKIPTFNWKSELSKLERYFLKYGGVIHIRTTSDSPSSAFAKALRSKMEHEKWEIPWQTIQIDGNNAATHYLADMIGQFERTLGLTPPPITDGHPNVTIASNIEAGGNFDANNIYVNNVSNGGHLHARADQIVKYALSIANEQRIGLLFFDSDSADSHELSAFRSVLWDDRLENLVSQGLLMIVFIDQGSEMPHWLPEPDEIIDLPARYSDLSARNAIEDIATYLLSNQLCVSFEHAKSSATTMIACHPTPKELYANFAGVLSRMDKWQ